MNLINNYININYVNYKKPSYSVFNYYATPCPFVHPEDDLTQINPAFSKSQIKFLDARFDECYTLLDDPCGTILDEIRPKMTMFNSKIK